MTAEELERRMASVFGEDFRKKAIVTPTGIWPLSGCFEECGLVDPKAPSRGHEPQGLFQTIPLRTRTVDPRENWHAAWKAWPR